jgi:hypothetical protein
MTTQEKEFNLELSRRKLLAAAGIGGSVVLAPYVIGTRGAAAAPNTLVHPIWCRRRRLPDSTCSSAAMHHRK